MGSMASESVTRISDSVSRRFIRPTKLKSWLGLMSSKNLCLWAAMISSSDRQRRLLLAPDHVVEHGARQPDRGEEVADAADHQRDGEAADGAGAVRVKDDSC